MRVLSSSDSQDMSLIWYTFEVIFLNIHCQSIPGFPRVRLPPLMGWALSADHTVIPAAMQANRSARSTYGTGAAPTEPVASSTTRSCRTPGCRAEVRIHGRGHLPRIWNIKVAFCRLPLLARSRRRDFPPHASCFTDDYAPMVEATCYVTCFWRSWAVF